MNLRERLTERITHHYDTLGSGLGWRLLYSPEAVLDGAKVAYIGLSPGGSFRDPSHAEFAMERGSAYVDESWEGHSRGNSPLQRQTRALFRLLGVEPEDALAGNLAPYRCPSWSALPPNKRAKSIAFGEELWAEILAAARPELVVCLGSDTWKSIRRITGAGHSEQVPIGWGEYTGERAPFGRGTVIRLPHLSRFAIFGRPESEAGIRQLFRDWIAGARPGRNGEPK